MNTEQNFWKKCSSCKKPIPFSTMYYVCSVSTCRHKRKGFQFCSVQCWDAHLGFANHREAWAVEERSPSHAESDSVESSSAPVASTAGSAIPGVRQPVRKIVSASPSVSATGSSTGSVSVTPSELQAAKIKTDTLVVVSKIKKLIKDQSGMNTSQCCIDALTKKVVSECLKGIEQAKKSDRKTVMGRDIR